MHSSSGPVHQSSCSGHAAEVSVRTSRAHAHLEAAPPAASVSQSGGKRATHAVSHKITAHTTTAPMSIAVPCPAIKPSTEARICAAVVEAASGSLVVMVASPGTVVRPGSTSACRSARHERSRDATKVQRPPAAKRAQLGH